MADTETVKKEEPKESEPKTQDEATSAKMVGSIIKHPAFKPGVGGSVFSQMNPSLKGFKDDG